MKRKCLVLLIVLLAVVVYKNVTWNITGGWEGIYLLSGEHGGFEVTDDIFPEDSSRYITGIPLGYIPNEHHRLISNSSKLHVLWSKQKGHGYIKNEFGDGRKLLINLSRYKTPDGAKLSGIFIGGGLPVSDPDYSKDDKNETGMAYYDGKRWFHIWCYINEAISSDSDPGTLSAPEQWHFVSSRVIENSNREFTIESKHTTIVNGTPVEITKHLFYEAGDLYATIVTRVKNCGAKPVTVLYMYGDEPWLGNYGSSDGNVGWTRDGLIKTEKSLNSSTNTYVGFFDYGNDLAGEQHTYTMKANFIQWPGSSRPQSIYFSNFVGHFSNPDVNSKPVPLASKDCRFLGLQWKRKLAPKESFTLNLAVGMAGNDPETGFPVKPRTRFDVRDK